MKTIQLFFILAIFIALQNATAQETKEFVPNGKAIGQIFFNYHYDLTEKVENRSQFELMRSYFGYGYQFSEALSTKVIFDAGYDERVPSATATKPNTSFSAFVKNAMLEWKISKMFTLETGMMATHIWDTQEKIWGYRYIMESAQDRFKFYSSADLGAKLTIKPADMVEFHLGMYNGEGYKKIQDNFGCHRFTADFVLTPIKGLVFKTYFDNMAKRDTAVKNNDLLKTLNSLNFFLGYEVKDLLRVGLEYDMQFNNGNKKDYNLNGISGYGAYIINKFEIFARYDMLSSNKLSGASDPWNISGDFGLLIFGAQVTLTKGVRAALNFRNENPEKSGDVNKNYIYLNMEFKF